MDLFRINTTAFEDEDFFLQTDLSKEQIEKIITPIVLLERLRSCDEEDDFYHNDDLINALIEAYPDAIVEQYIIDDYETISI
jgi:hypothetical protein